ncbi:acyl-CoA thioesterase [Amorphus orientalis]|uniref:Acyl-CoA thioesterase FadM n=1 Tax=Amorphus orientalis TaxID=649198 RepID=A0AAE3VRQ5_9HYPH|nr:acyl-CoA thioesterase [Amorphus orientalis]MDQ0316461.1 acyl-CoA thioesterase FadM [Amorphus orientalis]
MRPPDSGGTGAGDAGFVHPVKVRWADCDPAEIAYTGRIPNFALEAIDAWWEAVVGYDWYRLSIDRGYSTPFVRMEIDFLSPVTPRHVLECAVTPLALGDTSIRFAVTGRQDSRSCFRGEFVCVFVTTATFEKTKPVPDILALIAPHFPDAASERVETT